MIVILLRALAQGKNSTKKVKILTQTRPYEMFPNIKRQLSEANHDGKEKRTPVGVYTQPSVWPTILSLSSAHRYTN